MTTKAIFSNQLLNDIRQGKREAVKALYEQAFHYSTSFVFKNAGTIDDAREVFQEALFILIKNSQEKGFGITHDIRTYLYSICRNLWLKELRQRKSSPLVNVSEEPEKAFIDVSGSDLPETVTAEQKYTALEKCIEQLSPENRQLLKLTFFEKLRDKEIAPLMGISFKFVRVKRSRCLALLRKCMEA